MVDLYSTRCLTRTADKPGLFTVIGHDRSTAYNTMVTMNASGSSQCRQPGGGGGAAAAGRSPGGTGLACLLIGSLPSSFLVRRQQQSDAARSLPADRGYGVPTPGAVLAAAA